jgi:hypothetical protein
VESEFGLPLAAVISLLYPMSPPPEARASESPVEEQQQSEPPSGIDEDRRVQTEAAAAGDARAGGGPRGALRRPRDSPAYVGRGLNGLLEVNWIQIGPPATTPVDCEGRRKS